MTDSHFAREMTEEANHRAERGPARPAHTNWAVPQQPRVWASLLFHLCPLLLQAPVVSKAVNELAQQC